MYRPDIRDDDGSLPKYTWPGGYSIYYICADSGVLCPDCANSDDVINAEPYDNQWVLVEHDCNWEDPELYCDNCSKRIESAYAEEDNHGHV